MDTGKKNSDLGWKNGDPGYRVHPISATLRPSPSHDIFFHKIIVWPGGLKKSLDQFSIIAIEILYCINLKNIAKFWAFFALIVHLADATVHYTE
jgi:hypothetical protein